MAERVVSFFELIADSSLFEGAFKKAKGDAVSFAAAFKVSAQSVEADANKMGIAIERGIATGGLSRSAANQMIAQRLAFYGAPGGAAAAGTAAAARGGLGVNAGMFGLYAGLGAVGAIGAGAGLLTEQITQYSAHAAAVLRDSEAIGINAQRLQTYQHIAQMVGLDEQSMTLDFERFSKNLATGAPALAQTGLTLKDLGITSSDVGVAILQLSDYFHTHNDEAQKAAIAQALFGRSGSELIPILNQGSDAVRKYQAELQSMGALLSDSDLVMGARAQTAIQNFGTAFDAAKDRLLAAALPGFTAFFQELTNLMVNNGQLWTQVGSVISDVVSFVIGLIAGLSGTEVDLSKPPTNAAAAYEGLGGAAKDAAAGVAGSADATAKLNNALDSQIALLREQKRAQDEVYDAQKQALQDQLNTLRDVTDSRRRQGEDIVTYERRLEELGIKDKMNAVDKAKNAYDQQVDDHIAALEKEKRAVQAAAGVMGANLSSGISSGMNLGLSAADQATTKLNQKFVEFGKKFANTVKDWFKLLSGDGDLKATIEDFGRMIGDDIAQGMITGIEDNIPGAKRVDAASVLGKLISKLPHFAEGGFTHEGLAFLHDRELVLPLSKPQRSMELLAESGLGGAGGGIVINFNGPVADEMVANRVITKIDREMRKRGFNNSRGFGTG